MMKKKLLLYFPQCETEKPIVYHLVKDYNLKVNIFRAKVTENEEGYLVLDVEGEQEDFLKALEFLKTFNIEINETEKGVRWDKDYCTGCTACVAHCPVEALYIKDKIKMQMDFDSNKCIECLNCINICPYKACSSIF